MAGKVLDKLLNIIGLEATAIEDEDDETEDYYEEEEEVELFEDTRKPKGKKAGLVDIRNIPSHSKVVVYQPVSYDDTQNIVDNLKERRPVIINLETLDIELAQRVLDFISGAVYALEGTIQKVARGIFVIAPRHIDIAGNIPEESRGKNFYTLKQGQEASYEEWEDEV
jgi:cell division inhibitor SepF